MECHVPAIKYFSIELDIQYFALLIWMPSVEDCRLLFLMKASNAGFSTMRTCKRKLCDFQDPKQQNDSCFLYFRK